MRTEQWCQIRFEAAFKSQLVSSEPKMFEDQSSAVNRIKVNLIYPSIWSPIEFHGITSLTTIMAPKNQSINSSTSYGSPHFILLLQEVTWQSRSFLPAGWQPWQPLNLKKVPTTTKQPLLSHL